MSFKKNAGYNSETTRFENASFKNELLFFGKFM